MADPALAPATGSPCDALPGPAGDLCRVTAEVPSTVGDVVTDTAASAASSALGGIAEAFADSAVYFMDKVGALLMATTQVDLASPWFVRRYALMFGVSALLTLALLLLAVIKAVVRGQAGEAIRSGTVYYVGAVAASAFAPAGVYLLLQLSDGLSTVLAAGSEQDAHRFLKGTASTLGAVDLAAPGPVGPVTLLVTAVFAVLCAVVLWVELLLRTAVLYAAVLFAAPVFSGLVDRSLWRHSRRWIAFTISVIFAKPVVVAILSLAAAGAGDAGTSDSFSSVFVACALLLVAVFAVGLLFRIVPSVGDEIAGAVTARRELRSATPNVPLPGPGVVLRQSVQSHLVRSPRRAPAQAAAVAGPAGAVAAAGAAVHRAATGAVRRSPAGASSAVRGVG